MSRFLIAAAVCVVAFAPLAGDGDPRRAEHAILDGIRAESQERAR